MEDKILLSDFDSFKRVTYDDYVYEKGYPILSLSNISGKFSFEKRFNNLIIIEKDTSFKLEIPIDNMSIIDVLNIMVKHDSTLSVGRYKENSLEILNISAMFLADFSTEKTIKYNVSARPVDLNPVLFYKDRFNSKYFYQSLETVTTRGLTIPHSIKDNKLFLESGFEGSLYVTYKATDLKIQLLKEFVISDLSQLYSFGKIPVV